MAEGLVINDNWKPVGDDDGLYDAANEGADDLLVASTAEFIGLLGFFDPNNTGNDLTKGASNKFTSDGKEISGTTYPYNAYNPFFPSNNGTSKEYEKDGTTNELKGTQPGTAGAGNQILGSKDIWSGRYVRFDFERATNTGAAAPEFRYVLNNAEKFYYRPSALLGVSSMGSVSTISPVTMPNMAEPRAELPTTGISEVINIVKANGMFASSSNASQQTVPVDDVIPANGTSGSPASQVPDANSGTIYRVNDGVIQKRTFSVTYTTDSSANTYTVNNAWGGWLDYDIVSNFVARKLTTNGSAANADVAFIEEVIDELQASAKFRDGAMEAASQKHMTSATANDLNFDTYICATSGTNEVDSTLSSVKNSLTAFYTAAGMSTRNHRLESGTDNYGTSVNCASFGSDNTHGKWVTFATACDNLKTRLTDRIAEIDARIGKPTYNSQTGASAGSYPSIHVSDIPDSNTTGGLAPYGRSIYNSCNYLLGQDVDLLGGIIKDIESLTDLVDLVKSDRNKYEIFSGRDKEY